MKTLFLFILTVILAANLNARENPFEITDAFEDDTEKGIVLDEQAVKKSMEEAPYIKEMQEKMSGGTEKNKVENNSVTTPVIDEKTYSKKEVDTLIQNTETK